MSDLRRAGSFFFCMESPIPQVRLISMLWAQDKPSDKMKSGSSLFLTALQNDLPDWLLCHPCSLSHLLKAQERPHDIWRYSEEPLCVQKNGAVYLTADYRTRYQHAQLLMNQFRFGRSYTQLLEALSFSYRRTFEDWVLEGTFRDEIAADKLLLQFNQILLLLISVNTALIYRQLYQICTYLEWLS